MHKLAIAVGAIVISATAHVSITASGGYFALGAPLQIAVALGLIVGAICVGIAWRERRWAVAICLVVALAAGEAFAVIMTAERTVTARDIAAAPLRDAEEARTKAAQRVADATAALAAVPLTSPRLETALTAKSTADAAAIAKSAERNCLVNCRALLQAQVDAAQLEIDRARTELAGLKSLAETELTSARAALAALPPARSAAPLADRLGIAAWALDLITAGLASIAANGLGAALVSFGARGPAQVHKPAQSAPATAPAEFPPKALPVPSVREHAARFGLEMLRPGNAAMPVGRLYPAYVGWANDRGLAPFPMREIGTALDDLFARSGLAVTVIDGTPHLLGARLKAAPRRALGRLTPPLSV